MFTRVICFGDGGGEIIFVGMGIKIFPPVCGEPVGDTSCLPPSDNVNNTIDFPSGPSKLIALGIASPGLRFKTMDVGLVPAVVTGCFIAICLGKWVAGLGGL